MNSTKSEYKSRVAARRLCFLSERKKSNSRSLEELRTNESARYAKAKPAVRSSLNRRSATVSVSSTCKRYMNLWSLIPFLPLFFSFLVIFVKIRNRIENPRCNDETSLHPETTVPKSRVPRNSGQFFRKPKDPLCRFRFLNGPFLNTKQNDGKKDERDEARRGEPRRDWMRDEGSLDEDVSSRATFLSPVCSRPILSATERRTSIP